MRLFGTDGIRGQVWKEPLTRDNIRKIGYILGKRFDRILVVRDTRESGEEIEELLAEGITQGGGRVFSAGILPTSSLAYLVPKHGYSLGISISASHNPFIDNGIKLVNQFGRKLSTKEEKEIEEEALSLLYLNLSRGKNKEKVDLKEDYMDFLSSHGKELGGVKVILDSASGAGYYVAREVFSRLGARAKEISPRPNGRNINLSGSERPQELSWKMKRTKAMVGFAYDGDGDRCIWIDENGEILNGDHTLYFMAYRFEEEKRRWNRRVVATVMSNLALEEALNSMGITLYRAPVGDRFVFQKMMRMGAILGGEQSGHTIFREHLPTGDGILTSVLIASYLVEKGEKPSLWRERLRLYPQESLNIPVKRKKPLERLKAYQEKIRELRERFRDAYFLVRYSGTQPLLRVMVQSRTRERTAEVMRELEGFLKEILKKENILEES